MKAIDKLNMFYTLSAFNPETNEVEFMSLMPADVVTAVAESGDCIRVGELFQKVEIAGKGTDFIVTTKENVAAAVRAHMRDLEEEFAHTSGLLKELNGVGEEQEEEEDDTPEELQGLPTFSSLSEAIEAVSKAFDVPSSQPKEEATADDAKAEDEGLPECNCLICRVQKGTL